MNNLEKISAYARGFIASKNKLNFIPDGWHVKTILDLNIAFDPVNQFNACCSDGMYCMILGAVWDTKA